MTDEQITELRRLAAEHRDEADRIEREGIGSPHHLERDARCEREAADLIEEAAFALMQMRRCIGFFASCIKSGEAWSPTCEVEYNSALNCK